MILFLFAHSLMAMIFGRLWGGEWLITELRVLTEFSTKLWPSRLPLIIPYSCYLTLYFTQLFICYTSKISGSEIAPSWSPMRLKIECWRPEFHNCSAVGDLILSSEPFSNRCLTFYPADVFERKMKGVFPLTSSITSQAATFFCGFS